MGTDSLSCICFVVISVFTLKHLCLAGYPDIPDKKGRVSGATLILVPEHDIQPIQLIGKVEQFDFVCLAFIEPALVPVI